MKATTGCMTLNWNLDWHLSVQDTEDTFQHASCFKVSMLEIL